MADTTICDPVGMFGSTKLWLMLRATRGLDLPDFLLGSRLAYAAVSRLMYTQDWEALRPLVSDQMLHAMQGTMDDITGAGRRVVDIDGSITVHSAVLRQILHLNEEPAPGAVKCHLDVHITSHESWRMFDYHSNEALEPFDGRVRVQESTWRFEGVVLDPEFDPDSEAGVDGDEVHAARAAAEEVPWTVHAIV